MKPDNFFIFLSGLVQSISKPMNKMLCIIRIRKAFEKDS